MTTEEILARHDLNKDDVLLSNETFVSPIFSRDAIWNAKRPHANYALYASETIEPCRDCEFAIDIMGYYPDPDVYLVKRKQ